MRATPDVVRTSLLQLRGDEVEDVLAVEAENATCPRAVAVDGERRDTAVRGQCGAACQFPRDMRCLPFITDRRRVCVDNGLEYSRSLQRSLH